MGINEQLVSGADGPLIVITNGMAKSGSTLLAYYTRLLVGHLFPDNGQRALCRAIEDGKLVGIPTDAFVRNVDDRALDIIHGIAEAEGPVVVKTHTQAGPGLIEALRSGRIRMTVTHRDPRDMILSAMDHRKRDEATNRTILQEFTSVADCIKSMRWWVGMACDWVDSGLVHVVRYTDLVSDPRGELARLAGYLGVPTVNVMLDAIIEEERAGRQYGVRQFNSGKLHRYEEEMSADDREFCERELGDLIARLGYQVANKTVGQPA